MRTPQVLQELEPLFANWSAGGHAAWCDELRASISEILEPAKNGHMQKWLETIESLPSMEVESFDFSSDAVTFAGPCSMEQREQVTQALRVFHPWRKGPFAVFDVELDCEWRSDLKWQRVSPHIDLREKYVLDVGCGNGYYGWRMLGAGAACVVGIEPYPLYNMQYQLLKRFVPDSQNFVVPAKDAVLRARQPTFDVTFSMGVFYHCKNPIGHLEALRHTLKPDGTLVLETLVVDGDAEHVLIPQDRYAKMRNVWLIPSVLLLERMLRRAQFHDVQVVDVSVTSTDEQRRTEWMTFESLADFLDPQDSTKTIEGHPAPKRAVVVAKK